MKKIKMVLYGEPSTGKSVFACHAPNPFFICTDGNYEWLEDFGADMNAHADVNSWEEIKSTLADSNKLANYETIVVDLLEDAFKWCEAEYCVRAKIDHVSDVGYGKGYDITRNEFFIEISKLLAMDKNIILLMHGTTKVEKDRRGVEHTKYIPSPRIPDKVLDMIEGRVRYFLRCYLRGDEGDGGTIIKNRYLSLVPKENEFGIIRGIDENAVPHDIELDWDTFAKIVTTCKVGDSVKVVRPAVKPVEPVKEETASEEPVKPIRPRQNRKPIILPVDDGKDTLPFDLPTENNNAENVVFSADTPNVEEPKAEEFKTEPVVEPVAESKPTTEDKIARIKAKLAKMNGGN